MSRATVSVFQLTRITTDVVVSADILVAVAEIWRRSMKGFFHPYRPERHYMRGPGPKWCEKHGLVYPASDDAIARHRRQT